MVSAAQIGAVRDPYTVLALPRHASEAEVRHAYRRLARLYHPDRNPSDPGAAHAFAEIRAAYDALAARPRPRRVPPSVAAYVAATEPPPRRLVDVRA